MEMKKNKLVDFKESLRNAMIKNFERDGFLAPVMFFYKGNTPMIGQIPFELLENPTGKDILAGIIRITCQEPDVLAAGIIMEANGAKVDVDTENAEKLISGELSVADYKDKQDLIVMVFSTPEEEEMFAYEVNCENKTVGELFSGESLKHFSGTFANFFCWNKN
jgi:hypothetical protein